MRGQVHCLTGCISCACSGSIQTSNPSLFQDEEEVPPEAGKEQEEAVEKTDEAAQEPSQTEEKSEGEKSKEEPQTDEKKSDEASDKEEPQVRKLYLIFESFFLLTVLFFSNMLQTFHFKVLMTA